MPRSLFDLVVPLERVSRQFRAVYEQDAFAAARRLLEEIFAEFRDVDKSFIREFQTSGFSSRVFELALFAYLRERRYALDRTHVAPDYLITGDNPIAIEACTTNPPQESLTKSPSPVVWPPISLAALETQEREFVFQAGKALRRKLTKRDATGRLYWEYPHVAGIPFVIALQAFHDDGAYFHSVGFLAEYLYGRRDIISHDAGGRLTLKPEKIDDHRLGDKAIPSGLFRLPEASHLSGVLFSNSATINVFNRIGTQLGYGANGIAMIRLGTEYDPDINSVKPQLFGEFIRPVGADARETFGEGFHLLHNPWAEIPISEGTLPGITEHRLREDGLLVTSAETFSPFASQTLIFQGANAELLAKYHVAKFLGLLPDTEPAHPESPEDEK